MSQKQRMQPFKSLKFLNQTLLHNKERTIEFLFIFIGLPILVFLLKDSIYPIFLLFPTFIFIFVLLKNTEGFNSRELITGVSQDVWIRHGGITIGIALMLFLWTYFNDPENLFDLPKKNISLWIFICIAYPILSAWLQEIIFRTFIFHRYRQLFSEQWVFIFISALTFGLIHFLFNSLTSVLLSFLAGLYLAHTYYRTKSVFLVSVIHGFLGDFIFTIGMGKYFIYDMYNRI